MFRMQRNYLKEAKLRDAESIDINIELLLKDGQLKEGRKRMKKAVQKLKYYIM